jgi:hypothetical protein
MQMAGNPNWRKGVSGNPSGRPKVVAEVKELARQLTAPAMKALGDIVKDDDAPPAARVAAAGVILDRGYGKAPQHVTVERSPLDDLDPATLAALADALAAREEGLAGGDAPAAVH